MSWPSTLETKCKSHARVREGVERRHHHLRPEVGAADADVDDVGDAAGGRARTLLGVGQHARRARRARSVAERRRRRGGARSAVCSTARPSVVLIGSPREHRVALRLERRIRAPGRAASCSVAASSRFFDRSANTSGASQAEARRSGRGSRANASRRSKSRPCACVVAVQRGPGGGRGRSAVVMRAQAPSISCSSLTASAAKARMPSASFSVAIASSFSA